MPEYADLTFGGIDEGEFERDVNVALAEAAKALIKNLRVHDDDSAKAKVVCTIELKRVKGMEDGDAFSVKSSIKSTLPGRPDKVSLAIQEGDALVVRASGSDEASPRQTVLSTRDGVAVVDGAPQGPRQKEMLGR